MSVADFYHLPTLLHLRDLVAQADPAAPPGLWPADDGFARPPRRLGLLAGSFNPPHVAHLALARAALAAGEDAVIFVLSKRTVDKERVSGLALEDRLLILRLLAADEPRIGVALVNRGLYVDQAAIARAAFPNLAQLAIILGHDKIVQVFDARYYADRDAALDKLFARADVLVAPREGAGLAELDSLLARPENRRYGARVHALQIPTTYAALSSSALRAELSSDRRDLRDAPALVRDFLAETGAFAPPVRLSEGEEVDAYALRVALLDAFGWASPSSEQEGDLAGLVAAARRDDPLGREIRAWLATRSLPFPAGERGDEGVGSTLRSFQERAR